MNTSCPRCNGYVAEERDRFGAFRTCVMCGWLEPTDMLTNPPDRRKPNSSREPSHKGRAL